MANAKIALVGNLTRDPEVKEVNGQNVYSFGVGVSTSMKDEEGKYLSNFYDCSLWGKRGEYLIQHAKKGTQVFVTGDVSLAEFTTKDGVAKSRLRVNVSSVDVVSRPADQAAQQQPKRQEAMSSKDEMPF